MRIEKVNVEDDAAVAEWFGPVEAHQADQWGGLPEWTLHETLVSARDTNAGWVELHVAHDDKDTPVGSLLVHFTTEEDLDVADIWQLVVHPDHRRRGYGKAILDHAEQVARRHGRSRFIAATEHPVAIAGDDPGESFAAGAGFELGMKTARRCLKLPSDNELLDRLEAEARPHAEGLYEIRCWTGPCPDEFVKDRAELASNMSTDAPMGDLDKEKEEWSVERLRKFEVLTELMDRDAFCAGAIETSTGALVGFTQVAVPRQRLEVGWQYDTIVSGAHRGHRLGVLLKIANLRAVEAASPNTTRVFTFNADDNAPMIRVNEEMGFEVAANCRVWQRHLA